jgi:hypothetical protein
MNPFMILLLGFGVLLLYSAFKGGTPLTALKQLIPTSTTTTRTS